MALFLGAAERGTANTTEPMCAGKLICLTITDLQQASKTPAEGTDHYLTDSVRVYNAGGSANLVNLTVTMTWRDEGAGTTSEYRPLFSDPDCVVTAEHTLTCTTPKSLGPGEELIYDPLVFRTATDEDASDFTLTVTAAAKEQAKPKKGGAPPNDAVVTDFNSTTYEGDPDHDVSIAGGGIATTLGTSTADVQFSRLPVPSNASTDKKLFTLTEGSCLGITTCTGQTVTTATHGQSPVNLRITYTGPLPAGTTVNNIVVLHTYGTPQVTDSIGTACSGAFYTEPPAAELEAPGCRRVSITPLTGGWKKVELDVWAPQNGDWRWG